MVQGIIFTIIPGRAYRTLNFIASHDRGITTIMVGTAPAPPTLDHVLVGQGAKKMLKIAVFGFGVLLGTGIAYADEVEVHTGPGPAVVVPAGPRDGDTKTVVREHDGGAGCESKTVHKEDGMGDSKTVSKTNC